MVYHEDYGKQPNPCSPRARGRRATPRRNPRDRRRRRPRCRSGSAHHGPGAMAGRGSAGRCGGGRCARESASRADRGRPRAEARRAGNRARCARCARRGAGLRGRRPGRRPPRAVSGGPRASQENRVRQPAPRHRQAASHHAARFGRRLPHVRSVLRVQRAAGRRASRDRGPLHRPAAARRPARRRRGRARAPGRPAPRGRRVPVARGLLRRQDGLLRLDGGGGVREDEGRRDVPLGPRGEPPHLQGQR